MILKGRFVGALAALLMAWFGLASMMGGSRGLIFVVSLSIVMTMVGAQAILVFRKRMLEIGLLESMFKRYPEWKVNHLSLEARISELSQWSEWWYIEFCHASKRLEKFYAKRFNSNVSVLALEALWLEFELAKQSLVESIFTQGLELVKERTRDIDFWLKNYNNPLLQDEIDRCLSTQQKPK